MNRSATLSKALKKRLSNGSRIKFEFDQTFARLPHDFSFVLKEVGSCGNRENTFSNFCSTFARPSFYMCRINFGPQTRLKAQTGMVTNFQLAITLSPVKIRHRAGKRSIGVQYTCFSCSPKEEFKSVGKVGGFLLFSPAGVREGESKTLRGYCT